MTDELAAAAIHAMATMAEELHQPRLSEWLLDELAAGRRHSLMVFCGSLQMHGTAEAMRETSAGLKVKPEAS